MGRLQTIFMPKLSEETLRSQGFLIVIVAAAMATMTTIFALNMIVLRSFDTVLWVQLAAIPFYIACIIMVRKGIVLPAAYIVTWIPTLFMGLLFIATPSIIVACFLVLPILLASLVLSGLHMVPVALFSVVITTYFTLSSEGVDQQYYFIAAILLLVVSTLAYLGSWSVERAMRAARLARQEVETSNRALHSMNDELETRVTLRTTDLQQALNALQQRERELQHTLDELDSSQQTIQALSSPVLPVAAGVLVAPVIGVIDSQRASVLTQTILHRVENYRAHYLIIDVTGVEMIDTQVAQVLLQTSHALRLIGAQVIITGIRPEVAQTLVGLGIDMRSIIACSTLELGISEALERQAAIVRN